ARFGDPAAERALKPGPARGAGPGRVEVDQNQRVSSLRVLGVRVDCLDMAAGLERIEAMIAAGGRHQVATVNPEFVMHARRHRDFAAVLEAADLCLADGWGVVWAARRQGCGLAAPVTGAGLVPALAGLC